jgi:hypothetical protein
MHEDIEQDVSAELKFFLKPNWKHKVENGRFRVTLPEGEVERREAIDELYDEVWRIGRLVAYRNFSSIGKNPDGGYTLKSQMASGYGYEILFDPT